MPEVKTKKDETVAEKTKRIGESRVNRVLYGIEGIGKMGNGNYDKFTKENITKIRDAVMSELDLALNQLENPVEVVIPKKLTL
jgi:hypothetical protein